MDFTTVYLTPPIGEDSAHKVVVDCILIFEYLDVDGHRRRLYLDFLCDIAGKNQNDYYFVLQVWQLMFDQGAFTPFNSIDVWTDGGPKHFKTRFCQWMWHYLSFFRFGGQRISHHFFASYHGHSLADTHAASIKQVTRTEYIASQQQRAQGSPASNWGPTSAADLEPILTQHCQDTRVYVLNDIDRGERLKPNIRGLHSIKKQHSFTYEKGTCKASKLTNKGKVRLFGFHYRNSTLI
jgi:hypothetical protein